MHSFIFRRFIFRLKKTYAFSFSFLFFGTKMAVKTKKKVSTLAEPMHGRQSRLQSHIQPLSTSPPAEHEYCEAVSTEQTQSAVSAAAAVGLC